MGHDDLHAPSAEAEAAKAKAEAEADAAKYAARNADYIKQLELAKKGESVPPRGERAILPLLSEACAHAPARCGQRNHHAAWWT